MNMPRITLTTASTVYNLYTLVNALEPQAVNCSQVFVTADPTNTGNVFVGDSAVSTTQYGAKLPATASVGFEGNFNSTQLDTIYLMPDTTLSLVDVIIQRI